MKEIPLTQGKVALVDDSDFERLSKYKWFATQNRKNGNWYARTTIMTKDTKCGHTSIGMHRMILGDEFKVIDHKDGNGLNNQRLNLRGCSYAQNQMNKCIARTNKTGYKGVFFNGKKYVAKVGVNRRSIHLGTFSTAIEGAKAYNQYVNTHFGEFANVSPI
jgi:hypothetical protein